MVESFFSNLFIASDKSPEKYQDKITLRVDPERNNSYPWCEDRVFIKGRFSTTIEGAMLGAVKMKGCHLDDVRFIYQLVKPGVKGLMHEMGESPEEGLMNIVNIDVTDMIDLPFPGGDIEPSRSIMLRPFAIAIPHIIADEFTNVPAVHRKFSVDTPIYIDPVRIPIFTIEIKPFAKCVYEKFSGYETDGRCHRPEFIEFKFEAPTVDDT